MKNIGEMRWHRKSIRNKNHDYAGDGMYFVTICARKKQHLFGKIINGSMRLNEMGKIVATCWKEIPHHFPFVTLDMFVVMPNHVHGIIQLNVVGASDKPDPNVVGARHAIDPNVVGATHASPLQKTRPGGPIPKYLGSIIGAFKSAATKRINALEPNGSGTWWQRNFYEHIIHDPDDLRRVQRYIRDNPEHWEWDDEFSQR